MATPTYELIDSTTLTSTSTQVTFSSIPQTFQDLIVVVDSQENENFQLELGGVTSGVSNVRLHGASSSYDASSSTGNQGVATYYDSMVTIFEIMDYSSTDKYKTVIARTNGRQSSVGIIAGTWAHTSAINTLKLKTNTSSFAVNSTFSLYGLGVS